VKKWLKSVHIYGSYRKNKTGVPFFGTPCSLTVQHLRFCAGVLCIARSVSQPR